MNELILIIYFSGTGGVKRIVNEFNKQLKERIFNTSIYELDYSKKYPNYEDMNELVLKSKYIFLIYPVHAFDAPDIIYTCIENLIFSNSKVVIISVSGGG